MRVSLIIVLVLANVLISNAEKTLAQSASQDSTQHQRIVDRKKGESTGTKIARAPIRIILIPLWITDRVLYRGLLFVEDHHLIPKAQTTTWTLAQLGIFPFLGGVRDGAGFGGGVAWAFYRGPITATIRVAGSVKAYQDYRFSLDFSGVTGEHVNLVSDIRYISRPEEDFYGIGPDSREENQTSYDLEATSAAIQLDLVILKNVRIGSRFEYANTTISAGKDDRFPSTDEVFTSVEVPGLRGAELASAELSLTYDFRDYPSDPTSGGLARVSLATFEQTDGDDFDYWRFAFDLQGYLPLLGHGNRFGPRSHLGVRVRGSFNEPTRDGDFPFFNMPWVGGSSTVRGFAKFRFQDRNAVVANFEYRYRIQTLLQWVLFWDEGQVFAESDNFDFGGFRSSYGTGLRVVFGHNTYVRLEVGHSVEGTQWISSFRVIF